MSDANFPPASPGHENGIQRLIGSISSDREYLLPKCMSTV